TLQSFVLGPEIRLVQYVDDVLLSGTGEREVRKATIDLLNFWGTRGLRVSKTKLQFMEQEVQYLSHIISRGGQWVHPERVTGILSITKPKTKKEIRQIL
ncbi:TF26 protein, partial [Malurus elegans]|nr:TF26 protein [Malurus elegans]